MSFELSQYELEDTATLTFKNARGDDDLLGSDGKPVTAQIYSPGSPQGVKALRKSSLAVQRRQWRMLREQLDPNDAVNADREYAEKLTDFTHSFSENFPAKPAEVYANPKLCYLAKQVEEFIGKYGNFSKGSSAS